MGRPYKLTAEQENKLCEAYQNGISMRVICAYYDCCESSVRNILHRHKIPLRYPLKAEESKRRWQRLEKSCPDCIETYEDWLTDMAEKGLL